LVITKLNIYHFENIDYNRNTIVTKNMHINYYMGG
jgi:hypothetical protein